MSPRDYVGEGSMLGSFYVFTELTWWCQFIAKYPKKCALESGLSPKTWPDCAVWSPQQCCLPSPAQFSAVQTSSSPPETHKVRVWASQSCVLPLSFTFFLSFLPSILYHNKKLRLYHSNIRAPGSWFLNARSKQPTSPLPQLIKMNDTKNPALWDLSPKVHSKEAITSLQFVLSGCSGTPYIILIKLKLPRKKKVKQI